MIDGRPVTSSSSAGRLLTDIDLTIGRNDDIKDVQATNIPMYAEGRTPHQRVDELVKFYEERSRPLRETVVGRIARDITRTTDPDLSRENAIGNLIADAQLADTAAADRGDADGALMNPGGVRADLAFARSGSQTEDGIVTYEEAFTVQPFNNLVTTQTFTGRSSSTCSRTSGAARPRSTCCCRRARSATRGTSRSSTRSSTSRARGPPNPVSDVTIDGAALDPAASYRITTNNFLADGGDDFPSLTAGTNRTTLPEGRFDIDSLVDYLAPSIAGDPIEPPVLDRITRIP